MSRRVKRCEHLLPEGRCPISSCPHYDGGAKGFRLGKPKTRQCKRCHRSVDIDHLDENGFCKAECETLSGRVGYGRIKPDPVKAFSREVEEEKEAG